MGVANSGVPMLKLTLSVFSEFTRSQEAMANLCFQFSSSFRYVKFQVMHKICQSGHRGQTTKKTRTTKNKAQGLEQQTAVTPDTPTQQVFKISAAAQSAQKGLCLPPEPWGYQEPSGCQT